MAYDQRFAIGFIGSSGEGGAKLHRRNFGELVENLTGSGEYHWMAGNFLKYGGPLTPGDLPVDAHELIALCAPRPDFISYGASTGPGAEGQWVDQRGSFMAAVAAGPVFRLLGKKDLGTAEFPEVETALTDGELAFRQHKGGHTTGPNWPTFLAFADRYIKVTHAPAGLREPCRREAGQAQRQRCTGRGSWTTRAVVLDDTLVVGLRAIGRAVRRGDSGPERRECRDLHLQSHLRQRPEDGPPSPLRAGRSRRSRSPGAARQAASSRSTASTARSGRSSTGSPSPATRSRGVPPQVFEHRARPEPRSRPTTSPTTTCSASPPAGFTTFTAGSTSTRT